MTSSGVPVGDTTLTAEHVRIMRAINENRLKMNRHGRYIIDGEARPDRKSREQLCSRGLIESRYASGIGSYWLVTAKGKAALAPFVGEATQ